MEWLIIGLFVTAVSYFLNQGQRAAAKQDALDLQHDAQKFESDETDEARQFQEDFYLKYQSPEALMSQYRNLGASESASLMSAFGVSPSMPSPVKASSSPAGGLGAGVNTMSDLLNSLSGGFNQYMQGQKAGVETEWTPRVNQANIDATLGQLKLNWERFDLDKDIYNNISKPLAEMALDKSRQEIEESQQRIKQSEQQILNLQQQIKESNQNIEESSARVDLLNAQTETEGFKQANLSADSNLKYNQSLLVNSQTTNQNIQNQLDQIALDMSQALGFDVRVDFKSQMLFIGKKDTERLLLPPEQFFKGAEKTFDAILHGLDMQNISNKAFKNVETYFKNPFRSRSGGIRKGESYKEFQKRMMDEVESDYRRWLGFEKNQKSWHKAKKWIKENTRYGM